MAFSTRNRDRVPRQNSYTPSTAGPSMPALPHQRNGLSVQTPTPSMRSSYPQTTRSGPSSLQPNGTASSGQSHPSRPSAASYAHPPYPSGPLGFFLPPPGQATHDSTLSTQPTSQALHSTYPSRLRTGVTGLIQPENISGGPKEREFFLAQLDRELAVARSGSGTSTPRYDSPQPSGHRRPPAASGPSGRRGQVVNYTEKESSDEEAGEDEDQMSDVQEAASDPEDDDYGGRRGRGHRPQLPATGQGSNQQAIMRTGKLGKLSKKRDELDKGWTWLGDRVPGERVKSERARGTRHAYVSEEMLEREAGRPEMLVAITVDFDVQSDRSDHVAIKIKDRFLWNANEPFITPQAFSVIFCEDIGIPAQPYANMVAELINTQVEEAQNAVEVDVMDPDVTEDNVVWSEGEEGEDVGMTPDREGSNEQDEEDEVQEKAWDEADCRIIVNLDVQVYTHILRDRIEWDLSSNLPPSVFAQHYCSELGLSGEAIPLVAHAITDELIKHKRDALELELFADTHPEEQAKWDKTPGSGPRVIDRRGAKALVGVWRDWWDRADFGPVLVELTVEEMERREMERTREARRMMRGLTTSRRRR